MATDAQVCVQGTTITFTVVTDGVKSETSATIPEGANFNETLTAGGVSVNMNGTNTKNGGVWFEFVKLGELVKVSSEQFADGECRQL